MSARKRQLFAPLRKFGSVYALIFILAPILFACGSDDAVEDVQTFSFTADSPGRDQTARQLAIFEVSCSSEDIPPLGAYPIGNAHNLAEFGDHVCTDLSEMTDFDFLGKEYFVVLDDGNRCGKLLRREAFIKEFTFIYEVEYRFDADRVCLPFVVTEGFLFEIEKSP